MIARLRTPVALAAGALLLVPLAGCTDSTAPVAGADSNPRVLSVTATETACDVSAASAPSGTLTFSVKNAGTRVTEFYLLAADGLRILGEVENIGPGLTRDLVLTAAPGTYTAACKPGMVGDGIRSSFEVTDSGADTPTGNDKASQDRANAQYGAYVKDQTEQLLGQTQKFVQHYEAGDDDAARALYPVARTHWERIEPVAESFGDLDPEMDLREADLDRGARWTGWHRIEKDLWPARATNYTPLTAAERRTYAQNLLKNTTTLYDRTRSITFTADQIANGAKGLLEEVASTKVTGEEEYWSRTDLYDFQANVDGARVGFEGLQPLLTKKDPTLNTQIETRFADLQKLLDRHRRGDGFVAYDDLSNPEVKALAAAVDALSEPLSQLTAAVV
ncbi:MAG: iron uptake system protein EfeO [Propionibacteriaceae bacterium]